MKTIMSALIALGLGLTATLPASAAFGPKDVQTFDGPGFGPSDDVKGRNIEKSRRQTKRNK